MALSRALRDIGELPAAASDDFGTLPAAAAAAEAGGPAAAAPTAADTTGSTECNDRNNDSAAAAVQLDAEGPSLSEESILHFKSEGWAIARDALAVGAVEMQMQMRKD